MVRIYAEYATPVIMYIQIIRVFKGYYLSYIPVIFLHKTLSIILLYFYFDRFLLRSSISLLKAVLLSITICDRITA